MLRRDWSLSSLTPYPLHNPTTKAHWLLCVCVCVRACVHARVCVWERVSGIVELMCPVSLSLSVYLLLFSGLAGTEFLGAFLWHLLLSQSRAMPICFGQPIPFSSPFLNLSIHPSIHRSFPLFIHPSIPQSIHPSDLLFSLIIHLSFKPTVEVGSLHTPCTFKLSFSQFLKCNPRKNSLS
jgi:hypothetical protein